MDCKFEIINAILEEDMLSLSVKINCPYDKKALSPKIRLLFEKNGKTRRLPIVIESYVPTDDGENCEIIASYDYKIARLFLDDKKGDIELSFAFCYGADEIERVPISAASGYDKKAISITDDSMIISKDYDYQVVRHNLNQSSFSIRKLIKRFIRKTRTFLVNIYYAHLCKKPVVKNRVTFMSGRRNELGGNQLFVYDLIKDNKDIDFHFLTFSDPKGHFKWKYVKPFLELYATSSVVVIDDYFRLLNVVKKREDVKLFQLWHACGAFKTFGFTRLGKAGGPKQVSSNHRMYDYAIVSSANIAKHYAEGFGLSDENIIATGIPRTDIFASSEYSAKTKETLYSKYPSLKDKKVLLFAPTFRGNGQVSAYFPLDKLDVEKLYDDLGGEYAIIVKLHPFCKERYKISEKYKDCILDLSNDDELNDLLFITDLLITDYSSVVFEASLLDIPMLFYSYDLTEYVSERDFYYEYEYFVPGKIVYNQDELTTSIVNQDFDYNKVDSFKNKFFDNLDGQSSQRVADAIMKVVKGEA